MNNLNYKVYWEVLETKALYSEPTMRFDEELLTRLGDIPIIHFYEWEEDSATYGHFLEPKDYLNLEGVKKRQLKLGRRPTGGGIVFHTWDMAFSVLVPSSSPLFSLNTLENYGVINRAVLAAAQHFLGSSLSITPLDLPARDISSGRFCMAQPTKYDVILGGRKVAGAAQRKTKKGFLHQGTISLVQPDFEYLQDVLLPGTEVAASMQYYTQPLLQGRPMACELRDAKQTLRRLLYQALSEVRGQA
jgi:lipoate---protein ligase